MLYALLFISLVSTSLYAMDKFKTSLENPEMYRTYLQITRYNENDEKREIQASMLFNENLVGTIDNPNIECKENLSTGNVECSISLSGNLNDCTRIPLPKKWLTFLQELYQKKGIEGKW